MSSQEPKEPIVDIFIRTYSGDLKWLAHSLKSIHRFCKGFRDIIIVIPEGQRHLLDGFNLTMEKIFTCDIYKDDYLGQQITKVCADYYSDAEYIMFGDSDTLITRELRPEYLFKGGKPIILKTSYEKLGDAVPWKPITERAVGFNVEFEFMRRHPFLYNASTLKLLRSHIKKVHGKEIVDYVIEQPNRGFSEFNAIGAIANKLQPDMYYFQNTETEELPPLYVRQFFSWGGITKEVSAEIDEILR